MTDSAMLKTKCPPLHPSEQNLNDFVYVTFFSSFRLLIWDMSIL